MPSLIRSGSLFAVLVLMSLLTGKSGEAQDARRDSGPCVIRLSDGGRVYLRLLTEEIDVTTSYGKLRVPVAEIDGIDFGRRHVDAVEKKSVAADDVLFTTRFPIVGRIEALALKVHSRVFGEMPLRLGDLRQMRRLAVETKKALDIPQRTSAEVRTERPIRVPNPGLCELRLADGSLIDMSLLTKHLEMNTPKGKLRIPIDTVRRIDVGFRYPDGLGDRVDAAVARLGHANFRIRETAGKTLLNLREVAYPALKLAVTSDDLEIKLRATDLARRLEQLLPAELLRIRRDDVVVTSGHTTTGRIDGAGLRFRSRVFGDVQLQMADLVQIRPVQAELAATRELLEGVAQAIRAGRTTRTQRMGSGRDAYEDVPKTGALLTGFEITYGRSGNSPTVTTVRPIFLTRDGRLLGMTRGVPGDGLVRVEAKPGYAVGAVTIKAGGGVDGMSVTFMEIREEGLDPKRAYESPWLGGMGGGEKTKLVGSGAPIVGIFGATAEGTSTFNGLGLVAGRVKD
jgi:hypothetical protein